MEFSHFLVVDFEATCVDNGRIYPQEIIEFPAVIVDAATGRSRSEFRTYVRPRHHPQLTAFCTELTGIQQSQVDGGVELSEALAKHDAWLSAAGATKNRIAVVTWGDWDCKSMLEFECRFKGIAKPAYFDRWVNLRIPFEAEFGPGRRNLQEAVREAGLLWVGRLHRGLDDARNTAYLLTELMRRGVSIFITGSLAPALAPKEEEDVAQPQLQPVPQMGGVNLGMWGCGACAMLLLLRRGEQVRGGDGSGPNAGPVLLRVWQLHTSVRADVPVLLLGDLNPLMAGRALPAAIRKDRARCSSNGRTRSQRREKSGPSWWDHARSSSNGRTRKQRREKSSRWDCAWCSSKGRTRTQAKSCPFLVGLCSVFKQGQDKNAKEGKIWCLPGGIVLGVQAREAQERKEGQNLMPLPWPIQAKAIGICTGYVAQEGVSIYQSKGALVSPRPLTFIPRISHYRGTYEEVGARCAAGVRPNLRSRCPAQDEGGQAERAGQGKTTAC